MSEEDQDKSEEATAYKLEKAREQGQVARSADLSGVAVLLAFSLSMFATVGWIGEAIVESFSRLFAWVGGSVQLGPALMDAALDICAPLLRAMAPTLMAVLIGAVSIGVLQVGLVPSLQPLSPDLKRLNPMQMLKRLFSKRTLWETGKTLVKLAALGILLWFLLRDALLGTTADQPQPRSLMELARFWRSELLWAAFGTLGILVLAALADLAFVRWEFAQRMRMSRRELRDEHKRRDGDPEVRSKRKRLMQQLVKQAKALGRVPQADVIITNPVHLAVALQYRPDTMKAPIVLAKGAGALAAAIRSRGRRHGVSLQPRPPLARALFRLCDIDEPIPEKLYSEVAEVYRRLHAARR
jgi:flagellar biosynthetic protein FlhB